MNHLKRTHSISWTDVAMLGLVLVWGANYSVVKVVLREMSPLAFDALRFASASLLLLLLTWIIERDLSMPRSEWGLVLALGLVGNVVYQLLFINGIARTTASNSSLILASVPILVALGGTLTKAEKLYSWNWVGVLLAFLGIFLLITGGNASLALGRTTLTGDLLILAGTVCWSAYTLFSKRLMQRTSALKGTTWVMASSTPLLVLVSIPDLIRQNWRAVSPEGWLGLLYSAVLAIALGYIIWNAGIRRVGSARTALYSYLTPVVSVTVACIFLGENMRPLQVLGAAGILAGVVLGRYRP